ncbi:MAG: rhodanese-like domain-containing protein [Xanthomonadaceae bacterium]|nr:rhodanese-like domain-containing protein [Xanthomonadaceae bacterium]MDP2185312.1 rhodanese-like domain-containing protein [Xanthomonadales bacterium]MDZ4115850.1 rhodanese-like domain-containing protein [Xanthomonadaceae bacterium]MDZ4378680.1 rhodanese-like domain-containing protein [Xanthomonadaceae bacterium]
MHFRALIVFVALLICASGVCAGEPVAPRQLARQLQADNAPLVLDVRTQVEFDAGHIPGAVLIPHDQLAERFDEVPVDREVVVYCHSGRRSTLAERILVAHGRQVSQLDGSWIGWKAAGLPAATAEQMP